MKKLTQRIKPSVVIILFMVFVLGLLLGRIVKVSLNSENARFEKFSDELFTQQVSSNTLNLHYTLANPADYGITDYPITLGSIDIDKIPEQYTSLENCKKILSSFNYKELNSENQLAFDILDLHFDTELSLADQYLLQEMLSPSLGIQAQLPILLAEYTFRSEKDIQDYLALLKSMPTYFNEILEFQKEKSARQVFMSDTTVDRIVSQCSSFITNTTDNYLITIFEERIQNFKGLNDAQIKEYIAQNKESVLSSVIPAYQNLINGLTQLKGTGKNRNGLYYYNGGRDYYLYLLKSNSGIYDTVETLQTRLYKQLLLDYTQVKKILTENPTAAIDSTKNNLVTGTPEEMLKDHQEKMTADFPALDNVTYSIKYVHSDLEKYLSPAFYLTPPIDTLSPNSIYINRNSKMQGVELYTTLAHEGFPGHLYQTIYFASEKPLKIRSLLNMGGYIEGWATYVESYAYGYVDSDPDTCQFLWLNRSMNLCLYSLLDIGIHYYGWTLNDVTSYLKNFGITNTTVIQEIFQAIVEDPGNYLKYYMGYLNFADLRDEMHKEQGDEFQLKEFHQAVLEAGPAQFPVLEKHLLKAS